MRPYLDKLRALDLRGKAVSTTWRLLRLAKTAASHIPIYGPLLQVRWRSFKDGAMELGVATLFSLLPIWLYPVLVAMLTDQLLWDAVRSCVARGELYLYSAALLGPLIYSISKRYGPDGDDESDAQGGQGHHFWSLRFPNGGLFSVIAVLVCTLAGAAYAWMRAVEQGSLSLPIDETQTLQASVWVYVFTLSCMFCVLVYRLDLEDIPDRMRSDEGELLERWRERS